LKPTYGLVSIRGVIPLSWSLDHVGPMARTVADNALLLQAIAGYDEQDTTSEKISVPDYSHGLEAKTSYLRIGVPREFFFADLDPEIEAAMKEDVAGQPCSWTPEESEVESYEHQDNANIHCQPFP
jgi:aspartyl-tRNA(Asn)/glutamyl-tRNA(Gln) amidotransferase subunit A